jgi:hypothetical protein
MGNGCIIAVENLGKKYRIRHGEHERYVAFAQRYGKLRRQALSSQRFANGR